LHENLKQIGCSLMYGADFEDTLCRLTSMGKLPKSATAPGVWPICFTAAIMQGTITSFRSAVDTTYLESFARGTQSCVTRPDDPNHYGKISYGMNHPLNHTGAGGALAVFKFTRIRKGRVRYGVESRTGIRPIKLDRKFLRQSLGNVRQARQQFSTGLCRIHRGRERAEWRIGELALFDGHVAPMEAGCFIRFPAPMDAVQRWFATFNDLEKLC
jgi:hypothetical protein